MSVSIKIAKVLIRGYQLTLSSLIGRSCRHLPSCSEYTIDALERHGGGRGSVLALSRILRCNPFGSQGYDPVPETLEHQGIMFWKYGRWTGRHIKLKFDKGSST